MTAFRLALSDLENKTSRDTMEDSLDDIIDPANGGAKPPHIHFPL